MKRIIITFMYLHRMVASTYAQYPYTLKKMSGGRACKQLFHTYHPVMKNKSAITMPH